MKQIDLKFEHGRLVLAVGDKEFFISHYDLMDLLDRQLVKEKFHELDPAVIYAEWDNMDFISKYVALCEKGYSLEERAEYLGTTTERLESWQTIRAGKIQQTKDLNPSNFEAAVRGCKERIKNKKE